MTITTRLMFFFLSMLLLVLIGFSVAMYLVADHYLNQQVEERLATVLNSVCGAIETDTEGVEWEPGERRQVLEFSSLDDQLVWWVKDEQGDVVARSKNAYTVSGMNRQDLFPNRQARQRRVTFAENQSWLFDRRVIETTGRSTDADDLSRPPVDDPSPKHAALSVIAGVSFEPVQATKYHLALWLVGLSSLVWIVSFIVGRFVCGLALAPLRRMAVSAEQIQPDDLSQRLTPHATQDELDQLTQAFNAMLDRLQESFERQRRFTSDASHQLRTPLTAILGHVDVALRHERSDTDYQATLRTVQKKATHLSRVVEALLFLARSNREANLPSRVSLDLCDWLPTYLESWTDHPRFHDLNYESACSGDCHVSVQPALLAELLNILLDNAFKFSEPGRPIHVTLRVEPRRFLIGIEDHGCGIEQDELERLFIPFVRASSARRLGVEGVGLGLSIAKRLSQTFGGNLTATSQVNQGSCFLLWLPEETGDPHEA